MYLRGKRVDLRVGPCQRMYLIYKYTKVERLNCACHVGHTACRVPCPKV
jgi:hypothetical protein